MLHPFATFTSSLSFCFFLNAVLIQKLFCIKLTTSLWAVLDEVIQLSDSEEEEVVILEPQEPPKRTR